MPAVTLRVNGEDRTIDVPADMPLLWALRDVLGYTGPKFGCGVALCGSCTVMVNGEAQRSCAVPAGTLDGADVVTIEGLSSDGSHPLQQAWVEFNVPQCGYCQAGQIMNAAALLDRNADPSDNEIDEAQSGNLCRCGTYPRIRAAIKRAAQIQGGAR